MRQRIKLNLTKNSFNICFVLFYFSFLFALIYGLSGQHLNEHMVSNEFVKQHEKHGN